MYRMTHVTFASPAGLEQLPVHPWYSSTYTDMATIKDANKSVSLGALWELQGDVQSGGGNAFQLVRADEAFAAGDVLAWSNLPALDTVTGTSSTTSKIYLTGTSSITAGAEVGNLVCVTNAAGSSTCLRTIKANTASTITVSTRDYTVPNPSSHDHDVLTFTPAAGDKVKIIRPYNVVKCTSAMVPCAVALGACGTIGHYSIVQVAGVAMVKSSHSGAAVVLNEPVIVYASTPGTVTGAGTSAILGGNAVFFTGSSIIPLVANSSVAAQTIPCNVNFIGKV